MAATNPAPTLQVGQGWTPFLRDLNVVLVFRKDTSQWFFIDINQCAGVPTWVCSGLAMDSDQRKTFNWLSHEKHGNFEVAYFARVESGNSCNLSGTLQRPDYGILCRRNVHEQGSTPCLVGHLPVRRDVWQPDVRRRRGQVPGPGRSLSGAYAA